ncbi:hypothetical protein BZJ19_11630 [Salinivibrio proteolyticus]|uniref:phage tail assembly chaperone n=1 Tax=Salinivibrio proteolyticus TaxID=334715 RepID=UPI0009896BEB|nr:hypothetical protein [Salinivibrio proteolyticus]OOF24022.1 hypothetical protein BZJ19_11630 [Salinivibrio proteolyticus]
MYNDNVLANTEIDGTIVKIVGIQPIKKSLLMYKLSKAVLPSLGSLGDGMMSNDRSVMLASCFNILARNCNAELFDELQVTLLGSILGSDSNPLATPERINDYLESKQLNIFDLLVWVFGEQIASEITSSNLFKDNIDKLTALKAQVGDLFVMPSKEQAEEQPADDEQSE